LDEEAESGSEETAKTESEELKLKMLIGRDEVLKKEVYPRVRRKTGFILTGQIGIGKTELLKWAYEHYEEDKLLITCNDTYGEIIKAIAKKQGFVIAKKTLAELDKEIMKGKKIALFIANCETMKPKLAVLFTAWNAWNSLYMAGIEPFREEAKKFMWGKNKIKVLPLTKEDMVKLARHIRECIGTLVSEDMLANDCKGIPGRAWALAKGEYVREDRESVEGEEFNIAWTMMFLLVGAMFLRFIAMGMGEKDLYIIGGAFVALGFIFKMAVREAQG
jgi:hypothetical protein